MDRLIIVAGTSLVVSQLDTPFPGPADLAALGILTVSVTIVTLDEVDAGSLFGNMFSDSEGKPNTDANDNPLPSGATKLKGGQGYKLPDGTLYKPLRKGETGHHSVVWIS